MRQESNSLLDRRPYLFNGIMISLFLGEGHFLNSLSASGLLEVREVNPDIALGSWLPLRLASLFFFSIPIFWLAFARNLKIRKSVLVGSSQQRQADWRKAQILLLVNLIWLIAFLAHRDVIDLIKFTSFTFLSIH